MPSTGLGGLFTRILLASLLLLSLLHAVEGGNNGTVVDLGYAKYQGTFNATLNTTTFLGIRYASPPIGG